MVYLLLPLTAHLVVAQVPPPSIIGIVREKNGGALGDADVLVGTRQVTADAGGRFRLEGLPPGQYAIRIRHIGYRALVSRVVVVAGIPTEVEYVLTPAPLLLPTIDVSGKRTGIYGVVADTSLQPLAGARIAVLGFMGGEALTDSVGRFSFPKANDGAYLVQVTRRGYSERRFTLELAKGSGRELSFRLSSWSESESVPGEAEALWELRRRLALGLRRGRMMPAELARFGSMRLCDVPKVMIMAGDPTTVVLNGVTVLREVSLCSWRMDEIALLEFCGPSEWGCFNPDAPRPLRYPDPSGRRRRGGAVVLWEKR